MRREVEDLTAVINAVRGRAVSSGMASCLVTAPYRSLARDARCLGDGRHGLPADLAKVTLPVLGEYRTGSPSWLVAGTKAVVLAVPDGEVAGLDGAFHEVPVPPMAPVPADFYRRRR
ncbi:hypothetical protein [Actinophytocola sp.]|uniref:hypothetical protein n=1 Tax=Actinophytocola sp. TaxID=1872138 RepID=UPI002D510D56|nr:hypothetical protein [Actinophytocola sp.]HYQ69703.1 hypothetical protein [Actinophytocola sp.]